MVGSPGPRPTASRSPRSDRAAVTTERADDRAPARGFVALIGAPRSGTTWLQTLVASHDAVVSPQETNLFSRYVAPLEGRWEFEARGPLEDRRNRRFIGLGSTLTEAQFHEAVGRFVDQV